MNDAQQLVHIRSLAEHAAGTAVVVETTRVLEKSAMRFIHSESGSRPRESTKKVVRFGHLRP
jgi:hypothetical protein